MPNLRIPLDVRRRLWETGHGGVETALRYAAVELDLFFLSNTPDWDTDGDDGDRHYANFLAWSDSALVGIDDAVRSTGDHRLKERWDRLKDEPLRRLMRASRNKALKERQEVVGWELFGDLGGDGILLSRRFQSDTTGQFEDQPVLGTSSDYLAWIGSSAFPFLILSIDAGVRGPDARSVSEMPFPNVDPWTTRTASDRQGLLDWSPGS